MKRKTFDSQYASNVHFSFLHFSQLICVLCNEGNARERAREKSKSAFICIVNYYRLPTADVAMENNQSARVQCERECACKIEWFNAMPTMMMTTATATATYIRSLCNVQWQLNGQMALQTRSFFITQITCSRYEFQRMFDVDQTVIARARI